MKSRKRFLMIGLALSLVVFAAGCSFSFSTAKIEDAIMTNSVDAEGKPGDAVTSFTPDVAVLYTSAKLRNAPDNTKITIVWTYVTGNQMIDSIELDSGDLSDRYIYSNLSPTATLPLGDYQVEYFIEDRKEPDATVKFMVIGAQARTDSAMLAYLEDTHMTSAVDAAGAPVDNISELATTGTWYVSSILRNTQPDTIVHYVWYDTNGSVVDTFDLDPMGATDVYIFSSFTLAATAPEGQYRVAIFFNDETEPAAFVDFTASNSVVYAPASGAEERAYTHEQGGFSFRYPGDWKLMEYPEDLAVWVYPENYTVDGENDLNSVYVFANKGSAASYTINTLLKAWVDETEADGIENYAYIAQSVDDINGKDIASYSYSWTRGALKLYTVDALILDGADFYVMTFTTTQEAYDALYPSFEQLAISFEVVK